MEKEKIDLHSSFEMIFGKNAQEYTEDERKHRWEQWKAISLKEENGKEVVGAWMDIGACQGCDHLRHKAWCNLYGLPCTVNPVLSFHSGMIGMACMGTGHTGEDHDSERPLEPSNNTDDDLPF
jgi:hypothetical protein